MGKVIDFDIHKTTKYKVKTVFNRRHRQSIRLLKNALGSVAKKKSNVLQDILWQMENGMPKILLNRISLKGNYVHM